MTSRVGRPPRLVVVATIAMALVGGLWSVLTPVGEGPDEPAHVGLVLHLADGHGYPEHDGLAHQQGVIELCRTYAASTRWCPTAAERTAGVRTRVHRADGAPARSHRARWDHAARQPVADRDNQMPQHPPLAYLAMATVVEVERALTGGTWPVDREVALLRLFGVLTLAPLPALAWWAARRAGGDDEVGSIAAVAVLAVPQLTGSAGTVTGDALFTLLAAVAVGLAAGIARGDRRPPVGLALGIVCGLAFLTKAFAVVLVPMAVLAYVVGARGEHGAGREAWRSGVRRVLPSALLALGSTLALGAWWYVARWIDHGTPTPTIEERRLGPSARPPGFVADPGHFLGEVVERIPARFWASLGWYSVPLPTPVVAVLTLAGLSLVGVGLAASRSRRRGTSEDDGPPVPSLGVALVLLVPTALLAVLVVLRGWDLYSTSGQVAFLQGRYLFGGVTGLAVVAAVGARRLLDRRAAPALGAAALVIQVGTIAVAVDRWWRVDEQSWTSALRAVVGWGAWPAPTTVALLVGGVIALVAVPVAATAAARRQSLT